MTEKAYKFRVQIKGLDGKLSEELHTVSEAPTRFGEAFACGKAVRFYESLKDEKKIKDFRLLY